MIIGIDLGTTNSVVSEFTEDGEAEIVQNSMGKKKTPSVVLYEEGDDEDGVVVGGAADRSRELYPERTLHRTKQDIDKEDLDTYDVGDMEVNAVQVAANILKHLKEEAEEKLGGDVEGAVITVPYDFTAKGRQRTKQAGGLAGLDVKEVINEPTAACLSYIQENDIDGNLLVYDLGGGTFDATLVKAENNIIDVIATEGDGQLGGEDFDDKLYELTQEKVKDTDAPDPEETDAKTQASIRGDLNELKHNLSQRNEDFIAYEGEQITVTREEFEESIEDYIQTTCDKLEALFQKDSVEEEGISRDDIDHILLVGGSTRIPLVQERVEEFFGQEPKMDLDPDTAVAAGGAIQAAEYRDIDPDLLPRYSITDVLSHSLGVELNDNTFDKLLEESEAVPSEADDMYTNPSDNVTGIKIPVWEKGEQDEVLEDNEETPEEKLDVLKLDGLPEASKGELEIEVTFTANHDGTLRVEAYEHVNDEEVETTINVGLEPDELEEIIGGEGTGITRGDVSDDLTSRVQKTD